MNLIKLDFYPQKASAARHLGYNILVLNCRSYQVDIMCELSTATQVVTGACSRFISYLIYQGYVMIAAYSGNHVCK